MEFLENLPVELVEIFSVKLIQTFSVKLSDDGFRGGVTKKISSRTSRDILFRSYSGIFGET